jgi:hypothetical protein
MGREWLLSIKNAKDWSLLVNHFPLVHLRATLSTSSNCIETSSLRLKLQPFQHTGGQPATQGWTWSFAMLTLAQKVPLGRYSQGRGRLALDRHKAEPERREWVRLPLAIPIFVRSRDQSGKDSLEFATALNISAGGALVAVHRALRPATQVSLEIPSAPLAAAAPVSKNSRNLRAKIVRVTHAEGYHLLGLKFSQPLLSPTMRRATSRRKTTSSV